jgi:hypothetical protein
MEKTPTRFLWQPKLQGQKKLLLRCLLQHGGIHLHLQRGWRQLQRPIRPCPNQPKPSNFMKKAFREMVGLASRQSSETLSGLKSLKGPSFFQKLKLKMLWKQVRDTPGPRLFLLRRTFQTPRDPVLLGRGRLLKFLGEDSGDVRWRP